MAVNCLHYENVSVIPQILTNQRFRIKGKHCHSKTFISFSLIEASQPGLPSLRLVLEEV